VRAPFRINPSRLTNIGAASRAINAGRFEGAVARQTIKGSQVSHDAYRQHVIDTFRRNVSLFSGDRLPHHLELCSNDFFAAWDRGETKRDYFGNTSKLGGPISFAYIDGDHSYEQSMQDLKNVNRHLESGGFIVFDDSADDSGWGSAQTAQEAAKWQTYKVVAKNPNYCLRKRA
jgi:hypothetical protein